MKNMNSFLNHCVKRIAPILGLCLVCAGAFAEPPALPARHTTLNVCGYIAAANLYILCNPAVASPGLQLITADDLKNFWRSDHYGELSKGGLSRPAFVIAR